MKKTQKIFALIIAVLMVFSCFSLVVSAEEEATGITLLSAKITAENEYLLEFSSPIHFNQTWNILKRMSPTGEVSATLKSVEYITDDTATSEVVGDKVYSTLVKITYEAPPANFNLAKYGISIAEYGGTPAQDGAIKAATASGPNGELLLGTHIANNLDFVWIPTMAEDPRYAHPVHLKNVYEDEIVALAAEVAIDETNAVFTVHFSAPVRIGWAYKALYRWSPTSTSQSDRATVGYVNPIVYEGEEWSDTITLTYPLSTNTWLKGRIENNKDGGIAIFDSHEDGTLEKDLGYISPRSIVGIGGRAIAATHSNGTTDVLWIPHLEETTAAEHTVHYYFTNAPYVVGAEQIGANKIKVEFSEAVSFDPEGAANLCLSETDTENQVALTAAATDKANVLEFTFDELPDAFAEGAYGIAFNNGYITDAEGNALRASYVTAETKLTWIPTAAADVDGIYPVDIIVHEYMINNYDETHHWLECECGAIDEMTYEPHEFSTTDHNDDGHWTECLCGQKTEAVAHEYTKYNNDAENHWKECECGQIDETTVTEHTFAPEKDDTHHWTKCECGATTEKIEHLYANEKYNSETHWDECECGAKANEAAHDFGDGDTCACGAKKYVTGDLNGDEEVTADDAIYLLYHVFFPSQEDYAVNQPIDFNNDTEENADDAIYLLYHVFFKESGNYPLFPEVEAE